MIGIRWWIILLASDGGSYYWHLMVDHITGLSVIQLAPSSHNIVTTHDISKGYMPMFSPSEIFTSFMFTL